VSSSKEHSDSAGVTIAGTFRALDQVPVPLGEFVRVHGPAILLPYAREMISQLTSRGPFGQFLLAPINVLEMMERYDMSKSTGTQMLRDNQALAKDFGIEV
jgi:preprotein translocase subunit SecB